MPIRATCPQCGKRLAAPEHFAGKKIRCPGCQAVLKIPAGVLGAQKPRARVPADSPSTPSPPRPASASRSPGMGLPDAATPAPSARPTARASPSRTPREPGAGLPPPAPPQRYLYLLFAVALVPLVFSLLSEQDEAAFQERVEKTLDTYADDFDRIAQSDEIQELVRQLPENMPEDDAGNILFSAILRKLIKEVPGAKLEGAHLPGSTWMHWLYALLSSALFLGAILLLFEKGRAAAKTLLLVGLFTGTLGIIFLIAVQWVAEFTQGIWIYGRGIIALLFYILKFVGFSYRSALDPNSNFFLSFVGFTCGVGFCEELAKALPMLSHYRGRGKLGWRGACAMGLASGIGFGVAEGIMYSSDFYNGYAAGGIYIVRFISCVALHSVWSASVGIAICNRRDHLKGQMSWDDWAKTLLLVLGIPMVLHGLYDTMLKKDMNALALVTALVSFGFLVWLIEKARSEEEREGVGVKRGHEVFT